MSYIKKSPGLYQDSHNGHFYERPVVNGRRTWRRLQALTLRAAQAELNAHRTDQARATQGLCRDPYAPPPATIGTLAEEYYAHGCPDHDLARRDGVGLLACHRALDRALPFWSNLVAEKIGAQHCEKYAEFRRGEGGRYDCGAAIDGELGYLSVMLHWAKRTGRIAVNPLAEGRPKFRNRAGITHCRDYRPKDADELHALARYLFSHEQSEAAGWQLLLEAMTGCRTSEVLRLRWDAQSGQAGCIEGDHLWLRRSKGGINEWVTIQPALGECLAALRRWHEARNPNSPWFLPSPRVAGKPLNDGTLTLALRKCEEKVCGQGQKRTSHGLRAYYVTARRSQGVPDWQIAAEIGDRTGPAIIASTYGGIPPGWKGDLGWMPTKGGPAWEVLRLPANILPMAAGAGNGMPGGL